MRFSRRPLGLLLLVAVVGCGGQSVGKTVPVSGKVTMDGKPLANATVIFAPADAKEQAKPAQASGRTDAQGNYSLKLDLNGRDGAVPGQYKVSISIFDRGGDGKPGKGQLIPAEYNRSTTLQFRVPDEGSTDANFELSSNPSAPPVRRRGGR